MESQRMNVTRREGFQEDAEEASNQENGHQIPLPDEILTKIIRMVPMAQWPSLEGIDHKFQRSVHQAWRTVIQICVNEDLIVNSVKSDNESNQVQIINNILQKLLLRSPNIIKLTGIWPFNKKVRKVYEDSTIQLLARFRHLQWITFEHGRVTILTLADFLHRSASRGSLKKLEAAVWNPVLGSRRHCHDYSRFLQTAFGQPLALESFTFIGLPKRQQEFVQRRQIQGFEQIQRICDTIDTNNNIVILAINTTHLKTLDLGNTELKAPALLSLLSRCPQIERLTCRFDHKNLQELTQVFHAVSSLEMLVTLEISLSGLSLFNIIHSVIPKMVDFIRDLGKLRYFKRLSMPGLSSGVLAEAIADYLPHLTSLSWHPTRLLRNHCCQPTMLRLVTELTQLEDLHLLLSPINGHTLITAITTNLISLKHLHLILTESYDNSDRKIAISPRVLEHLALLKNLKELIMEGFQIGSGVLTILGDTIGPQLESVSLRGCQIQGLPFPPARGALRGTGARWARQGGPVVDGLEEFLKKLRSLRRLNLAGVKEVTDVHLRAIGSSCPLLRVLELAYDPDEDGFSGSGVKAVIDGCPRLKYLNASGYFPDQDRVKVQKYRKIRFERPEWPSALSE